MKREKALWTGGSSGDRLWCKSGQTGRLALRSQKNHITISGVLPRKPPVGEMEFVNNSKNLHKS